MLRVVVRNKLNANDLLRGTLAGGIYPLDADGESVMDRKRYPAAWDATGQMLPTALVQDNGIIRFGSAPHSAKALLRVLFWQGRGRGAIESAMVETIKTLNGAGGSTVELWVYRYKFVGQSQPLQDSALRDAEHGWLDFEAPLLIGRQ